jgi:hypothetical protein
VAAIPARTGTKAAATPCQHGRGWHPEPQQRPAPAGGTIFQREWFRYYDELPPHLELAASWDMSFKDRAESDYVVGQIRPAALVQIGTSQCSSSDAKAGPKHQHLSTQLAGADGEPGDNGCQVVRIDRLGQVELKPGRQRQVCVVFLDERAERDGR